MDDCRIIENGSDLNRSIVLNNTSSENKELFQKTIYIVYGFALPIVCTIGIIGNILNLAVLSRMRSQANMQMFRQAANLCLIALAISDLLFCIFALPSSVLPTNNIYSTRHFRLYYKLYSAALINVFIMSSTWLMVMMTLVRFLAIFHPLKPMTFYRAKVMILAIFLFSIVFNIPVLWRYKTVELHCQYGRQTSYATKQMIILNAIFDNAYKILWAVIGNLIPLILLFYFSISLCKKIHKSSRLRRPDNNIADEHRSSQDNNTADEHRSSQMLTKILIVIVVFFFILVAPSEVIKLTTEVIHIDHNYTYQIIEVITNFMQMLNFAINFLIYCIISPYFRYTLYQTMYFATGRKPLPQVCERQDMLMTPQ